ncbi:hypothetical protein GW17_00050369 [Ensete ventricosum]|nr:hypothetical protein GW17_00050369 [Ensete ventricosum]
MSIATAVRLRGYRWRQLQQGCGCNRRKMGQRCTRLLQKRAEDGAAMYKAIGGPKASIFGYGAWMAVEGAVGLSMAGLGVTLVLRTSWFNCSSWIREKEIVAIRVYDCRAFTSPRISGFRPSIKVPKSCLTNICQLSVDVVEIGWSEAV